MDEEASGVTLLTQHRWDRSAQLVSLAQLLVDPGSRTLDGLMRLVHKDWLAFGHQFGVRHALHGESAREQSFVFTQFLDCVWQLLQLHPEAFEFTAAALEAMHTAAVTGTFGTFLGNSDCERRRLRLHDSTPCLWRWMHEHRQALTRAGPGDRSPVGVLSLPEGWAPAVWRRVLCRPPAHFRYEPLLDEAT